MCSPKRLADAITYSRAGLAVVLAALGALGGAKALPLAVWLMIADWTGDLVDGALARREPGRPQTWIGAHDLEVDMLVSLGLLIFLVAAGLLPVALGLGYAVLGGLVFARWGVVRSWGMLFQAPIYGWLIWSALTWAPAAGTWIIAWLIAVIALTWPRLPRSVVPGFLDGLRHWRPGMRR